MKRERFGIIHPNELLAHYCREDWYQKCSHSSMMYYWLSHPDRAATAIECQIFHQAAFIILKPSPSDLCPLRKSNGPPTFYCYTTILFGFFQAKTYYNSTKKPPTLQNFRFLTAPLRYKIHTMYLDFVLCGVPPSNQSWKCHSCSSSLVGAAPTQKTGQRCLFTVCLSPPFHLETRFRLVFSLSVWKKKEGILGLIRELPEHKSPLEVFIYRWNLEESPTSYKSPFLHFYCTHLLNVVFFQL